MDRIGPYVSLPNIPSPNGIVKQHPSHPNARIEVNEFACGPPFVREFSFTSSNDGTNEYEKNTRQLPFVHEERSLLGSSYHKLDLNFLFSGQSKT